MFARTRLLRQVGVLLCLAPLMVAAACSSDPTIAGPGADPGMSSAPTPSTPAASTSPAPSVTPTPSPAPAAVPPDWEVEVSGTSRMDLAVAAAEAGIAIASGSDVRLLDADGEELWRRADFAGEDLTARWSQDLLVVTYRDPTDESWPGTTVLEALDPTNGETAWREEAAPYTVVTSRTVYTPVCRGEQTGASDDCRLSARDPNTGEPRWTVPAEHVATVVGESDEVVVLSTKPMGLRGKAWITTLDARTGERLGVRIEAGAFDSSWYHADAELVTDSIDLVGDVLVAGLTDPDADDDCRVELHALNAVSGDPEWRKAIQRAPAGEGREAKETFCRLGLPDGTGGALFANSKNDRPTVLDLSTGEVRWRGPDPGTVIVAGTDRFVMVRDEDDGELALYDLEAEGAGEEEPRWTVPGPSESRDGTRARILDGVVVAYDYSYGRCVGGAERDMWRGCADVYDLRTGEPVAVVGGDPIAWGTDWVGTWRDGERFALYRTSSR